MGNVHAKLLLDDLDLDGQDVLSIVILVALAKQFVVLVELKYSRNEWSSS